MATYITVEQKAAQSLLIRNRRETLRNREQLNAVPEVPQSPAATPLVVGGRRELSPLDELAASRRRKGPLLLLHFDGSNGSTAFVDSGRFRLPVSRVGNVAIATTPAKFNQSGAFIGVLTSSDPITYEGGYLSVNSINLAKLGQGDFTIELWVYVDSNLSPSFDQYIVAFPNAYNTGILVQGYGESGARLFWSVGTADNVSGSSADADEYIAVDAWHHIAFVRVAGVVSIFVNGIRQTGEFSTVAQPDFDSTIIQFGEATYESTDTQSGGTFDFRGWMDEVRIDSKVYYSSNFTPPTAPF